MTEVPGPARDRLAEILGSIAERGDERATDLLVTLVDELRPSRPHDGATALTHLHALEYLLTANTAWRDALAHQLAREFSACEQSTLYSDLGILPSTGFFSELWRRVGDRLLPAPYDAGSLRSVLARLFHRNTDLLWVGAIADEHWARLFDLIGLDFLAPQADRHTLLELLESVRIIAYRLAATGLEPDLAEVLPDLRRFESAFVAQQLETERFIAAWHEALRDGTPLALDHRHILVLLDQCEQTIARIRRNTPNTGVSVALTYRLQRASENIERQRLMLPLLDPGPGRHRLETSAQLFKRLVAAECARARLRPHFSRNTELLAREITEHAGRTGEHYITSTTSEYRQMFRAALGAGAIVPLLAFAKLWLHDLHAAPLIQGLLYGLNYAIGFVLIQVMHFTLATKQPAMTATHLAMALDAPPGQRPDPGEMVEMIVRLCRSQFIAIVGNIVLAFPLAFAICLAWGRFTGDTTVTPDTARHLMEDLHPWQSFALFHAAIAGVYLFLAGLVSGYFDNAAVYRHIPDRIRGLPWLRRIAGDARADRLGRWMGDNLGGLAGNVAFGFMLGLTGVVGYNLGLPLDIRHVTFAAANFGIALEALREVPSVLSAAWVLSGIALIGVVNLTVSFALALMLAMRARRLRWREMRHLVRPLLRRLGRTPLDFFRPPPQPGDEVAAGPPAP
jgi:site-specific recombinase